MTLIYTIMSNIGINPIRKPCSEYRSNYFSNCFSQTLAKMAIKGKNAAQTFSGFVAFPKDTIRKIRKTVLIYICGIFSGSKLGGQRKH